MTLSPGEECLAEMVLFCSTPSVSQPVFSSLLCLSSLALLMCLLGPFVEEGVKRLQSLV